MKTTTIRVDEKVRSRIAERAKRESKPMSQVIDEALEAQADREFWEEYRQAMLKPEARQERQEEAERLSGGYRELLTPGEDWTHLL